MSTKSIAIGIAIVVVSIIGVAITEPYVIMHGINPAAALAAVTVAVIGVMWLKKTAKP